MRRGDDSGVVAILVAVFSVVMFVVAALVVDLGMARDRSEQVQAVADAAALAGVGEMSRGGSRDVAHREAREVILDNWPGSPNWSTCPPVDVANGWSAAPSSATANGCITFRGPPADTEVRVVAPTLDSPSFFGGLVGYSGASLTARAQARMTEQAARQVTCALCVVDTSNDAVDLDDDSSLAVSGDDVRIGGGLRMRDPAARVAVTGGAVVLRGAVNPSTRSGPPYVTPAAVQNDPGPFGDPFATSLTLPSRSGPNQNENCPSTSLQPGVYDDDVTIDESCFMSAGVYVFEKTLRIEDDAVVGGLNVTLFFVDDGELELRDEAQLIFSAPTTTRLAMVFDNSRDISLEEDSRLLMRGTLYAPDSELTVDEDASASLESLLVLDKIELDDEARLSVSYSSAQNIPFPPGRRMVPGLTY